MFPMEIRGTAFRTPLPIKLDHHKPPHTTHAAPCINTAIKGLQCGAPDDAHPFCVMLEEDHPIHSRHPIPLKMSSGCVNHFAGRQLHGP